MIQIVIIDDYLPSRRQLGNFIKQNLSGVVISEYENAYKFLQLFNPHNQLPDIVFVDINLPIIDGIAFTLYLKIHFSNIKVICFSSYNSDEIIKLSYLAGSDGYLFKGFAERNMINAIKVVQQNEIFIDSFILKDSFLINKYIEMSYNRLDQKNRFDLTKRELSFVMLAATMLRYEQIADLMFVDIRTIHTYFNHVKVKLNISNRQELIIFALQNGLAIQANYC
jgi:DNA-binding NarL/FixJ family response regulator